MTKCFQRCTHCVKSVQIRSLFWSVFSLIRTVYGKMRTTKISVFGHFSRSDTHANILIVSGKIWAKSTCPVSIESTLLLFLLLLNFPDLVFQSIQESMAEKSWHEAGFDGFNCYKTSYFPMYKFVTHFLVCHFWIIVTDLSLLNSRIWH